MTKRIGDRHHIPSQLTPFIGRQRELEEIRRLLSDSACRLLTLVGPGGIGKTRLALESTNTLSPDVVDDIYFVALQPLTSVDFIIPAVAEAVNFQFYAGSEPKSQLLEFLHEKTGLLIFDNFEHLINGSELISDILAAAPAIKILISSRERLNLVEEWVYSVEGLPVPEHDNQIMHSDAVRLFSQSAQRVKNNFTFNVASQADVIRICRLVGGMPLGIELAAGWVHMMSCSEIADEIARGLDVLSTSTRNIPPRHRTIRAVLDQSWTLLSEHERTIFQKLSVFRGGFRKEAAAQIAGSTLSILSTFVNKSLLRVDGKGRYELHELLRQYAEEKLDQHSVERERTLTQHAVFFADFMLQRETDILGNSLSHQINSYFQIDAEIDNVRQAWIRAVSTLGAEEIEKFLWSLLIFYDSRGWLFEGEEIFEKAAQIAADRNDHRALGQLYARQAWFSVRLGRYEKAKTLFLTSLSLLKLSEIPRGIAFSLVGLGVVCIYRGEYAEADAALRDAAKIYQEQSILFEVAWLLDNQAKLLRTQGKYEQAKEVIDEAIRLCRTDTVWDMFPEILLQSGQIMEGLGDYEGAWRAYQESMARIQQLPFINALMAANCTTYLGRVAHRLGKHEDVVSYYRWAFELSKQIRSPRHKLELLLGMIEFQMNNVDKAQVIEWLSLIVHHTASLSETRQRAQTVLNHLKNEMLSTRFVTHVEEEKTSRLDAALETVFVFLDRDATPNKSSISKVLTEREVEILSLMAQGLSNREIAERLFLSVGTVKWYGSQICSKLQAKNRLQAIIRAQELQLLP